MALCITNNLVEIRYEPTNTWYTFELSAYQLDYHKLWSDAERTMSGKVVANFIGIFPSVVATSMPYKDEDVKNLSKCLNQAWFMVRFHDTETHTVKTAQYYAADFTTKLSSSANGYYEPVEFELIPVDRRP